MAVGAAIGVGCSGIFGIKGIFSCAGGVETDNGGTSAAVIRDGSDMDDF